MMSVRDEEESIEHGVVSPKFYAQKNTYYPPIYRLPTELLETIFTHCAIDHYFKVQDYRERRLPGWVNVSYVCRHWQNVALDCSRLWTHVFVISPRWTEALLTRSRQASLKICVENFICDGSWWPSFEKLLDHVERIQELCLKLPLPRIYHVLSELSSGAPRLQDLKLVVDGITFVSSDQAPVLFPGDTPALRTLELSKCPVPWYSFRLNNLTSLVLQEVPLQFCLSLEELLATLRCMQDLRHLCLDKALDSAAEFRSSASFKTFQRVDLPHLSCLMICAPFSAVIGFLSCVNIPLKTELRLHCLGERGLTLDDCILLPSLLEGRFGMFEDQASMTIRSLAVEIYDEESTFTDKRLALATSGRECDFPNPTLSSSNQLWGSNCPLTMCLELDGFTTGDMHHVLNNIYYALTTKNVRTLHVRYPPFSASFWRITLRHFPNLRYLRLAVGYIPLALDLASALSHMDLAIPEGTEDQGQLGHATSDEDAHSRSILPLNLEELELAEITLSVPEGDPSLGQLDIILQHVLDTLFTSNSRGLLVMSRCHVHQSQRRFTVRGVWDVKLGAKGFVDKIWNEIQNRTGARTIRISSPPASGTDAVVRLPM